MLLHALTTAVHTLTTAVPPNAGTQGLTAHYNSVALASLPANTSVFDTAHFFALFNVAQFDGRIAYFTMKYDNLFWRPITAIHQLGRCAQQCVVMLTGRSRVQFCLAWSVLCNNITHSLCGSVAS